MTYANHGRFSENCAVLVRYPRTPEQEKAGRESWPWLPGSVLEQCGPDEWRICVEAPELAEEEDGEVTYTVCYRNASELRPAPGRQ